MDFKILTTVEEVRNLCISLMEKQVIGLDIETAAFDGQSGALEPRHGNIRLIQINDDTDIWIIDCYKLENRECLQLLKPVLESTTIKKVIQNAKFELRWFKVKLGIIIRGFFDTYLAAKLVDMSLKGGLAEIEKVFLGEVVDKEEQKSNWGAAVLSEYQYSYAARDVKNLLRLRTKLIHELFQTDQIKLAEIEFNCAPVVAHMETVGFPVNKKVYEKLIINLKKRRDIAKEVLREQLESIFTDDQRKQRQGQGDLFSFEGEPSRIVKPLINLSSWQQVAQAYAKLGITLEGTSEKAITPLMRKYPELQKLMDFRKAEKSVTANGDSILSHIDPLTGRIHTSFWQLLPDTGRFSSQSPNIQNVPHGREFRMCWRPKYGRRFVIGDWSQFELRILANFSKDKKMIEAFTNDWDLHSTTAKGAFNLDCAIEDVAKLFDAQRQLGKILNFSTVYGIGPPTLADRTGKSLKECKDMIQGFYNTYPEAAKWLFRQEEIGPANGYVRSIANRYMKLTYDPNNPATAGFIKRNARNYPIQASNADILKRTMAVLHNRLEGYDADIVNVIHDEIIVETTIGLAAEVKEILHTTMIECAQEFLFVPMKADAYIATSWAGKGGKKKRKNPLTFL